MTGLDIVIVLTVFLAAVIGFWRGILRPIIGIAGFFAGLVLATAWYGPLAQRLWPGEGAWASVVSFALILLVVLVLTGVISAIVVRVVHATPFGILDRVVGLVVALLIALAGWIILLGLAVAVSPSTSEPISQSAIAPLLLALLADSGPIPDVAVVYHGHV